jgi:hypothetical protein
MENESMYGVVEEGGRKFIAVYLSEEMYDLVRNTLNIVYYKRFQDKERLWKQREQERGGRMERTTRGRKHIPTPVLRPLNEINLVPGASGIALTVT